METHRWRSGELLKPIVATYTLEAIGNYSQSLRPSSQVAPPAPPSETIHNDAEFARRKGWDKPVGYSPQLTAHIYALLCQNLGEASLDQGSLSLTFMPPFYADETITATGQVVDIVRGPDDGHGLIESEILIEVWCEDQSRRKIAAGRAVAHAQG